MKPMIFVVLCTTILCWGCRKQEGLSDRMDCVITGELLVWESDKKVSFDGGKPPVIILEEQRYYKPWSSYRVPLTSSAVDSEGRFRIEYEMVEEGEYYLNVAGYHPEKYWNKSQPRLQYRQNQNMDYRLVAISWVKPRFINEVNLTGDIFVYKYGIGDPPGWFPIFTGETDTLMPWVHQTWGGSKLGQIEHFVSGLLTRNGLERDTKIYYFVPPGDTSIVEIRY
jgi:hypothetical protein